MTYILEASACMIIFYIFYSVFLSKKSFHGWNRFYLLFSLLASLLIPTLTIPVYQNLIESPTIISNNFYLSGSVLDTTTNSVSSINWYLIGLTIYIGVALFFLSTTLLEILKITSSIRNSRKENHNGIIKVYTDTDLPMSSFLNYLLIPDNSKISQLEFEHEAAHIQQYHSIDKMLIAILKSFFWFNPFIYLYQRRISEIHEYLADLAVIDNNSKSIYLDFLQDKIERQYSYQLVNPFYSLIKNRLIMINQHSKSSKKIFLLVAPIAILLIGVFACNEDLSQSGESDHTLESSIDVRNSVRGVIDNQYILFQDTITFFDEQTYDEAKIYIYGFANSSEVAEAFKSPTYNRQLSGYFGNLGQEVSDDMFIYEPQDVTLSPKTSGNDPVRTYTYLIKAKE